MHVHARTPLRLAALAISSCLIAAGCGSSETETKKVEQQSATVTVITHDSFALDPKLKKKFETDNDVELKLVQQGDVGTLVNKLVLTKDSPLADAVYGIDNTFASRAVEEGVLAPGTSTRAPEEFALEGEGADQLAAVDYSDVCINIDDTWFAKEKVAPPKTLDDLTEPAYKGLTALPAATSSSPGLAFLIATIAAQGDDWQDYWTRLVANDVEITSGWSEAYEGQFTQGGGKGRRPIVLSYSSSPPFTVGDDGKPTTSALLDTCFRQVEYVGVLKGSTNTDGAEKFVEFMQSDAVQASLPDSMYVYPVVAGVELPEAWAAFATTASKPWEMSADTIAKQRTTWLREWRDIATR